MQYIKTANISLHYGGCVLEVLLFDVTDQECD